MPDKAWTKWLYQISISISCLLELAHQWNLLISILNLNSNSRTAVRVAGTNTCAATAHAYLLWYASNVWHQIFNDIIYQRVHQRLADGSQVSPVQKNTKQIYKRKNSDRLRPRRSIPKPNKTRWWSPAGHSLVVSAGMLLELLDSSSGKQPQAPQLNVATQTAWVRTWQNNTKHLSWKGKLEKDMLDTSKSGACVLSSRDRLHSPAWHCDIVHILGWPARWRLFSVIPSEVFPMISPLVRLRRQPQENHGWLPTARLRVSMPEPYHASPNFQT